MSRAILLPSLASTQERFSIEEGLGESVAGEMSFEENPIQANYSVHQNRHDELPQLESNWILVDGIQVEIVECELANMKLDAISDEEFSQPFKHQRISRVRSWKNGFMTFIEIAVPNNSAFSESNINSKPASVSTSILKDHGFQNVSVIEDGLENKREDRVRAENQNLIEGIKSFPEFEQSSVDFSDRSNLLESSAFDFECDPIGENFNIPKGLPEHVDLMDLWGLFKEGRQKDKVKVKSKVKNH